jgi:hypothetical protein
MNKRKLKKRTAFLNYIFEHDKIFRGDNSITFAILLNLIILKSVTLLKIHFNFHYTTLSTGTTYPAMIKYLTLKVIFNIHSEQVLIYFKVINLFTK